MVMPRIQVQAIVPASPEAVYEHVTAFAVAGRTGRRTLEEKYGRLVGRDGDTYTFKEDTKEGVNWRCTFHPPTQRVMQAPGTTWVDRIDWFYPWGEGTIWTVVWQGNVRAFAFSRSGWAFSSGGNGGHTPKLLVRWSSTSRK